MKKLLYILLFPILLFAQTQHLDYGFEDWTGDADTTPGYIFGTDYSSYWAIHEASTRVLDQCNGWTPYEGSYFFYRQFYTGVTDSCLGNAATSLNDHGNIGDSYIYGHGNSFSWSDIGDTVFVYFQWQSNSAFGTMCGGYRNKWFRLYTDQEAVYAHMSNDGAINLYDFDGDGWGTSYPWPGGNPHGDGNWHSFALWADLTNNGSSQGVIKIWLDSDDWDNPSYTDSDHNWGGATRFDHLCISQNFSADDPTEWTSLALDNIEIWDDIPTGTTDDIAPTFNYNLTKNGTDSVDVDITSISADVDTIIYAYPDSSTSIDTAYTNTAIDTTIYYGGSSGWVYLYTKAVDDSGNYTYFGDNIDSVYFAPKSSGTEATIDTLIRN